MRRMTDETDVAAEPPVEAEAGRLVAKTFAYTSQIAEPAAAATAAAPIDPDGGPPAPGPSTPPPGGGNSAVTVVGTAGNDLLLGGDGADLIAGFGGNDLMAGGGGDDQMFGGEGEDTILGQNGNDVVQGGGGSDWLLGDAGNDQLFGDGGNDQVEGGLGNDVLDGGSGQDILRGGDGNDVLTGGAGRDVMFGDAGSDRFVVSTPGHRVAVADLDRISDFDTGGPGFNPLRDVVDVGDALIGTGFTGTSAAQAFSQGYLYLRQHGTPGQLDFGTTLYLDLNGKAADAVPDLPLVDLAFVHANTLHTGFYSSNFLL